MQQDESAPGASATHDVPDAAPFEDGEPSNGTYQGTGLYQLLVESVRDYAIFALDAQGRILTWNAGAERLKGYSASEIIGKHFSIFYPPEVVARGYPAEELRFAARDGRFEDEGWRLRKDGSRFWANVVITALRNPEGELIGFGKVTRDLTERRAAEEEVRRSEERFRLLVQDVRDYGIFMLDPTGCVVSWNEGAQRIQGYTSEEILGRHFSIFYPAEDVNRGKPAMELRVAQAEGRFEDEDWRVRKDGTLFWANVVITAVHGATGDLIGFSKVTRDLTERRAAEQRAIAAARRVAEVEAANRAKSEFLAAMSHELRTPLNAIGGYVELLQVGVAGPLNQDQNQYADRIRRSQQHLLGIINDLLNFSRMEAGQVFYTIRDVPVNAVIQAVMPMIEPQAASKRLDVTHRPCADNIIAKVDRTKLEQILVNLLSNAVKFTPSGGSIDVSCAVREDNVEISVTDTGIGIPEDKIESVFEPFVQVGRNLTTQHEGTGLGLAISRDLARAMKGDIRLSSRVDHGSTFTVVLPHA